MPNKRLIWVMTLSGVVLSGAVLVTLRGVAHAAPPAAANRRASERRPQRSTPRIPASARNSAARPRPSSTLCP